MDYNPHRRKLHAAQRDLDSLNVRATKAQADLDWYRGFDRTGSLSRARRLDLQVASAKNGLAELENTLASEKARAPMLEESARQRKKILGVPLGPTAGAQRAKRELNSLQATLRSLASQIGDLGREIGKLQVERDGIVSAVRRFDAFDPAAVDRDLTSIRANIQRMTTQRDAIAQQADAVDLLIAPEMRRLAAAQTHQDAAQEAVDKLSKEIDRQYKLREEAFELRDRLNMAQTSYDRALIHEESERRFGNGKPGAVAHECKLRAEALKEKRRNASRQCDACRSEVKEVEARIRAIVRGQTALAPRLLSRPSPARAWIRLAQMEAYVSEQEARLPSGPARTDLDDKRKEAAEFRNRLEGKSARRGQRLDDQRWWGGRELDSEALGTLDHVAGGGQAKIHHPSRFPGLLYKEYMQQGSVRADALDRLIQMRLRMKEDERDFIDKSAAWPAIIVKTNESVSGFLMAAAAEQFFHRFSGSIKRPIELQFLTFPPKPAWSSIALPTPRQRIEICLSASRIVSVIHSASGIVGDISAANILWSLNPLQAYLIDCDGIRVAGHNPVLPQVATPHWVDPKQPNQATIDTDCYKLAQVVVRVLSIEPYREPKDGLTATLPCTPPARTPIDRLLARFAASSYARPSADEWVEALTDALAQL